MTHGLILMSVILIGFNVLLKSGPKCYIPGLTTILGDAHFHNLNLKSGHLNGIPIDSFLTMSGDQKASGNYIFANNTSFNAMIAATRFDTILLNDFVRRVLMPYADKRMNSKMHFQEITCLNGAKIDGPINQFENFDKLVAVVRGRPLQVFHDNLLFKNLVVDHLGIFLLKLLYFVVPTTNNFHYPLGCHVI